MSAILSVRVYGSGHVGIRFDDGSESPTEEVRLDTAQRRMIELFRDWLAQGWAKPKERKITRRRELEVLGMLLYARLFPGPLEGVLDQAVRTADRNDPLRVELSFVDGAEPLAALPWEYLFRAGANGAGGYFLATDARLALSRYIPLNRPIEPLAPEQLPLRLLATASKPTDEGPVREAETLAALAALSQSAQVKVEVLEHPTGERLEQKLRSFRPHVVHLLAHGEYDAKAEEGRIALERDEGTAHWVPDHLLIELFRQAGATPHVVLLHACEGGAVGSSAFAGLAPRLVDLGSEAVIAMQYPITNNAANAFGAAFYAELAKQRPIDAAVQAGRSGMTLERPQSYDTGEFGIPVLYLRSKESTPVTVR